MSEFTVELYNRSGTPIHLPPELTFDPLRWSFSWRGGPDEATIDVMGESIQHLYQLLRWLRYEIKIRNDIRNFVWWGYVHEIDIDLGGVKVRLSLENLYNRVKIQYSYRAVDGTQQSATTAWAEDTVSQDDYGIKELITTLSDADSTQAEAFRDAIVDKNKVPIATYLRGRRLQASLYCRGWWHTLGWQYYTNDAGRIEHDFTGGTTNTLGLGVTASDIGFTNDTYIHSIGGDLLNFDNGTKITITGSTSNNATRTIDDVDTRAAQTYTNTTISAEPSDDFKDSARRLSFIDAEDVIQTSGFTTSALNDFHQVRDPGEGHIEIYTGYSTTVTTEAAGNSVTVKRGNKLGTGTSGTDEQPGSSVTIVAHGEEISQKFNNSTGYDWTVDKIAIQVQKVGSPTDDLTVALYSDSSGSIGTLLDSGTIDDGDVSSTLQWIWCDLSNTDTISNGTDYWIKITRAGSNDPDNFYRIGIHEDELYAAGDLSLYDGSSWNARATNADLLFRVWGAEDTAELIEDMLDEGEFWNRIDVDGTSGIDDNQYRDGTRTAKVEIERLLDMGDSTGGYLVAHVDSDKTAKIYSAPAESGEGSIAGVLAENGQLLDRYRRPMDKGRCIVGDWVWLSGLPSDDDYYGLSPLFIERCEYSVQTDSVTVDARGSAPLWGN